MQDITVCLERACRSLNLCPQYMDNIEYLESQEVKGKTGTMRSPIVEALLLCDYVTSQAKEEPIISKQKPQNCRSLDTWPHAKTFKSSIQKLSS